MTTKEMIHTLKVIEKRMNKISSKSARYPAYEASVCVNKIQKIINLIESKE